MPDNEVLMQICRRGVAPFATGMSTIKYHMHPPCGTNPAWRQGLAGRPATAGCAPRLPGESRSEQEKTAPRLRPLRPFAASYRPATCPARRDSCVSCHFVVKNPGISVNSPKPLQLRYLHLIAASCSYLHLIATNCTSCASCDDFFFS